MFEGSDKIARWNQYLIAASGLLAMNYWIDRGVVKAAAKYTGPVGVGILLGILLIGLDSIFQLQLIHNRELITGRITTSRRFRKYHLVKILFCLILLMLLCYIMTRA